MKMSSIIGTLAAALCIVPFTGCEVESPAAIFVESETGRPSPEILSVDPPGGGISGVTRLTIHGKNFSPVDSLNHVFIDSIAVPIDSATSTAIYVKAPNNAVGNNLKIKVTVDGAFAFAVYTYNIEPVGQEFGAFTDLDNVISISTDKSNNMYAQLTVDGSNVRVMKISPSGNKTQYAKGPFNVPKISQMRMGPDGYLYCQRSASNQLYRVAPGGGDSMTLHVTLPIPRGSFFDFDSLGNAYIGGRTNATIAVLLPNSQTVRTVGSVATYEIRGVRVFNGYVYLLAVVSGKKGIFRAKILSSDGNLSAIDTVYNLSLVPGFGAKEVMGFAIASDGDIFVAGDHTDPVYRIRNGTAEPLYAGLLTRPVCDVVWGTGKYVFLNRNSNLSSVSAVGVTKRVIRVITEQTGAPDFGG